MVKTTVERKALQWLQPSEEVLKVLKKQILAELGENNQVQHIRKNKKDR